MADSTPPTSNVDAHQLVPRVAFVGLCERSAEITEGLECFWHTNIIGVSQTKVFNIFPANLEGLRYIVALHNARVGERFTIRFRRVDGKHALEFFLYVGGGELLEGGPGVKTKRALTAGELIPGWNRALQSFPHGSQVPEPGVYNVLLAVGDREQLLATVQFLHLRAAPLTPEIIAAIRSDPLAVKVVRVRYGCPSCGDVIRAYAGVEKNSKLESEGWIWFECLPERFRCTCGKIDLPLEYTKTGLHGLLSRRLAPLSTDTLSCVRLYEQSALEEQARNFKTLITRNAKEEDIQVFLEKHPIFFTLFQPIKLMFKQPILTRYKSDFAVLTSRKELLLVEIERATLKLLKADGGVHHQLQHAVDQVRDWLRAFDDYRAAALDAVNLTLDEVAAVRGVVIAGRTPHNEKQLRNFTEN